MNKSPKRQPSGRVPISRLATHRAIVAYLPIESILPDPSNPRKHSLKQIRAIANSIEAFGFNAPILVDNGNRVVAGHGRLEAGQLLGLAEAWIPERSATRLREADLNVLSKLGK
jgi:hypothetical protein